MTRAELMRHALSQRRAAWLISCERDAVGCGHIVTAGNLPPFCGGLAAEPSR
jgi:hypothetical protein